MANTPEQHDTQAISKRLAVPLGSLMSGPLQAIIQAQAQAAQTTVEFIEQIGFEGATENDLGSLRTITFHYTRLDAKGTLQKQQVEIPLLSLVNIPNIEVKDAQMEYAIKVASVESQSYQPLDGSDASFARISRLLAPSKTALKTTLGSLKSLQQQGKEDLQMKITMRVAKAELSEPVAALYERINQEMGQFTEQEPDT